MDNSIAENLLGVLEKEAALYETILELSKNKTRIVVEGKVTELENIVKLEQSLIMQMRKLEDERERLVSAVSKEIGVDSSRLTISELSKYLKGKHAEDFMSCQKKIGNTLDALQNTNELNSKLIHNSLEYIDFSINLFTAAGTLNNNYGSTGQADGAKKRNLFDVKL